MGSKSSEAPPPDPRLVEAQLRSMGIQDDAISQVLEIARRQQAANEELQPLQRQAMEFGLESSKTAYDQSQADRQWLLGRRDSLAGLQDQLITEARDFNTEAAAAKAIGIAQADVGKSLADIRAAKAREMATMGVAPGSGRFMAGSDADAARAMAAAANGARTQARNEGRMLTDRAVNALAGYPAQASSLTGQGASLAAGGLNIANAGAGGINSGYSAMMGGQQLASGLAGSMGSNASSMYGTQANYKLAADRQANDTGILGDIGSLAGGAAQLYTSGIFGSDRAYKDVSARIGTHARLGIGIYRFRYKPEFAKKWGDGEHVGVMADEVEKVLPSAVSKDSDGHTVVNYGAL